ncbi:MAG: efflux RND transporter periplasmic adaptor subunit [Phycisphaerae bacterium]|nr:efflux RND transporter periplasmic adaptor subunit [Phycisphaerae bacterium]
MNSNNRGIPFPIGMTIDDPCVRIARLRLHRKSQPARRLLVILSFALTAACGKSDKGNVYAPPPPPEVIVAHPQTRSVTRYLTYTGSIEASETVELQARVAGFLRAVNFKPGQRVKRNDLLFVIDQREYQANLDSAKALVDSAKATLDLAQTTLERAQQAFEQGGTSDLEVREKKAARDEAKASLDLANARVEQARLDLEYCEIRAPIEGRIGKNLVDVGNLVGRGESTLLAEIVQPTPAFVSIDVSEADVLQIRRERQRNGEATTTEPGQVAPGEWRPCELALAGETDFREKGRVDYVNPRMDTQTGTLLVRTRFENTDERLLPGLFARVRFPMSSSESLTVPEAALLSDQQGRFAMVVNDKDEIEARRVRIGTLDGTVRVVEEGLKPEDRVVILGVLKARPGAKVAPRMQEPAAAAH